MNYTLSEHAIDRAGERLTVNHEWLQTLLADHSVEVVVNPRSPRRHRVFWSIPDEGAYVAVVNRHSGEVITIYSAQREDMSSRIMTDRDAVSRTIHATYVKRATIREAMKLVGLREPVRDDSGAKKEREFVARFITRQGRVKAKIIERMANNVDIDDVLSGVIDKAIALAGDNGGLGLSIELRHRGSMNIIAEWVMDETVAYGLAG